MSDPRSVHPSYPVAARDDPVDVRSRFDGSWCGGFQVAERLMASDGSPRYRVRRLSDGFVLPGSFAADEVVRVTR